jgi:hypothetical protein
MSPDPNVRPSSLAFTDGQETSGDYVLKPGTRIRLTALGVERCPKLANGTGVIVAFTGYLVRLDGTKSVRKLHRTYVMRIDRNDG